MGKYFGQNTAFWEAVSYGGNAPNYLESNHLGLNFDSTLNSPVTLDKSLDPLDPSSKNRNINNTFLIGLMTSV